MSVAWLGIIEQSRGEIELLHISLCLFVVSPYGLFRIVASRQPGLLIWPNRDPKGGCAEPYHILLANFRSHIANLSPLGQAEKETAQVEGNCLFQLYQRQKTELPCHSIKECQQHIERRTCEILVEQYNSPHNDSWNSVWTELKFTNQVRPLSRR